MFLLTFLLSSDRVPPETCFCPVVSALSRKNYCEIGDSTADINFVKWESCKLSWTPVSSMEIFFNCVEPYTGPTQFFRCLQKLILKKLEVV